MSRRLTKSQQERAIELLKEAGEYLEDYFNILISEYNYPDDSFERNINQFLKELED